jgi:transcriptional regulator with XRE-family HTH domain
MHDADGFYKRIGELIRKARGERKLAQGQLAEAVGLTRTSISNIESGRQKLLLHTFCDIADNLNLAPAELLPPLVTAQPDSKNEEFLQRLPEAERAFIERAIRTPKKN